MVEGFRLVSGSEPTRVSSFYLYPSKSLNGIVLLSKDGQIGWIV